MLTFVQITEKENPYIEILTQWLFDWWGEKEGFSHKKIETYLTNSLCHDKIPQTYVALLEGEVIGLYQFSMYDNDVRPDIYPWLINVFLKEEFRGHGYFNEIMESIKNNIEKLGLKEIYLFTSHEGLYEKYGWEWVENFDTFLEEQRIQRLYRYQPKV